MVGGSYFVLDAFSLWEKLFQAESTHFESVEDFQRTMLVRDDRDVQADESVSLRSIITPHPHQRIMYDLLPNQSVRFQHVPVRINSCGMRGAEISVQKQPQTIRIAFLGDSFVFGWGVEEADSFVEVTGEVLNRYLEGTNVQVEMLNFGVPGYSTFQEVEKFVQEGVEFAPDIAVVFFIQNDFGLPFFIGGFKDDGEMMTSQEFARSAEKVDDPTKQKKKDTILGWLDPNKALRALVRDGRERGYSTYLAFNPHPKWRENYQRLWFAKKSKRLHSIFLRARFLEAMKRFGIEEHELSLTHDPHPSAVKHSILGALLAESLLPEVVAKAQSLEDADEL